MYQNDTGPSHVTLRQGRNDGIAIDFSGTHLAY